jgi:hypothetical protein
MPRLRPIAPILHPTPIHWRDNRPLWQAGRVLDSDVWESGKTPLPHPLFIEPDGSRRRYLIIQMYSDLQITPLFAQELFGLVQRTHGHNEQPACQGRAQAYARASQREIIDGRDTVHRRKRFLAETALDSTIWQAGCNKHFGVYMEQLEWRRDFVSLPISSAY